MVKYVKETLGLRILYADNCVEIYLTRLLRGERLEWIWGKLNISKNSAIEKIRKKVQAKGRLERPLSKLEAVSPNSEW